jgi:hypothetical protein
MWNTNLPLKIAGNKILVPWEKKFGDEGTIHY